MPQIRVGIVGDCRKVNNQGQAEFICNIDGAIDRGIVEAPLGTLHPVHNACAVGLRCAISPNRNARIVSQCLQYLG